MRRNMRLLDLKLEFVYLISFLEEVQEIFEEDIAKLEHSALPDGDQEEAECVLIAIAERIMEMLETRLYDIRNRS